MSGKSAAADARERRPDAAERAADAAERAASGATRLLRAWRKLPAEHRLAAYSAVGLFLALFLPWYQETVIVSGRASKLESVSATITGWGAFSFVEAVILLIAAAVLILLFRRAEGRGLQLPGGDGRAISGAGVCASLLIVWRIFDKQGTTIHGPGATASGIEWGIFVALAIATLLTYAGSRIRTAERTGSDSPVAGHSPEGGAPSAAPRRRRSPLPPPPVPAQEPATKRMQPAAQAADPEGSTAPAEE